MIYFILIIILAVVVIGLFALSKGEGEKYSAKGFNSRDSKGNDHFNSFTI